LIAQDVMHQQPALAGGAVARGTVMPHVALLGDSTLDNGAYVLAGEPDVAQQVRMLLPNGWSVTLLAKDGSVTDDIAAQLHELPPDATHLVVSVGGNDALGATAVVEQPVQTVAQAMALLGAMQATFEDAYQRMLSVALTRDLPLTLCTIYNGAFPDAALQQLATLGAAIYDDVILRAAATRKLPAIDLRLVCTHPEDYANPIEPSAVGGAKIAAAIVRAIIQSSSSDRAGQ
jgi:hypothetical protein